MADQFPQGQGGESKTTSTDRGLFDCFGKKEEKPKADAAMAEAEQKPSLMEKLHRSNSSSSSSSEEEVEEGGVKTRRRKTKGLTEKIKEKLPGHKNEGAAATSNEYNHHHQAAGANAEEMPSEEKKGFLEKIKEKMPGHHKDEVAPVPAHAPAPALAPTQCGIDGQCGVEGTHEPKETKGILEKIKEKLPGGHKDDEGKKEH